MSHDYDHIVELEELEARIGYSFQNREFLERALTHRSYANEHAVEVDNQRLEFLGDAVLGLVTARDLFDRFTGIDEGALSVCQAQLVNEAALAEVAVEIELGSWVRLGKGESLTGGRHKASLLADAYEALLAAVFLDGGLKAARGVILRLHDQAIGRCRPLRPPEDFKSRLQRWMQSQGDERPDYAIVAEQGPAHDKRFVAEVRVDLQPLGRGEGRSKKEAEQLAAANALDELGGGVDELEPLKALVEEAEKSR